MEIKLELNKDVNYNAEVYFNKSKKLKAKLQGIDMIINKTKKEIEEHKNNKNKYLEKKKINEKIKGLKKKEWYDKFRWTKLSSENLFVIGKDAGTNEVLIKKYVEDTDIILHSEAPGSPFGIIKNCLNKEGNLLISKNNLEEAGQFLLCFSSQWKKGFGTADAFWIKKEQVTKKSMSGEYMTKGSFMIYGDKNMLKNLPLKIGFGIKTIEIKNGDEVLKIKEPFSGSYEACKKFCNNKFVKLDPGQLKYKLLSRNLSKLFKVHIDELPKYIPNDCKILKR